MYLAITDGITTVVINDDANTPDTGLAGARYFPRDPGTDVTVTETAEVVIAGDVSPIRTTVNKIERLLKQAAAYQTNKVLAPVYIEHNPVYAGGTVYRSLLYGGRVTWSDERKLRQVVNTTAGEISVIFTRDNFWETASEQAIGFSLIRNGSASPGNGIGLNPPNGALPMPIRVTMTNQSNPDMWAQKYYLFMDHSGISGTENFLAGGTKTWFGLMNHNEVMFASAIGASLLGKLQGQEVHILGAFSALSPSNMYLRASLHSYIDGVYWPIAYGNEVWTNGKKLINFGTLTIPHNATIDLRIMITGYTETAGSATLTWLHIAPAADSVELTQIGDQLRAGDAIVEDGPNKRAYYTDFTNEFPLIRRTGGPLLVYPGLTNRFYMLFDEDTAFNASRTMFINVNYRPRRATI